MKPILTVQGTKAELRAKLEREYPPRLLEKIEELHAQGRDDVIPTLLRRCLVVHPARGNAEGILVCPVEMIYPEGGFPDLCGNEGMS